MVHTPSFESLPISEQIERMADKVRKLLPAKWDMAIDGDAATGKDTAGVRIAELLRSVFINSGDFYRSMAIGLKQFASIEDDAERKAAILPLLENHSIQLHTGYFQHKIRYLIEQSPEKPVDVTSELSSNETSKIVSKFSRFPEVRSYVNSVINDAVRKYNVIMAGRDIGLVVIPDALFHFILKAPADKRAERRYKELVIKNPDATYSLANIKQEMKERDGDDQTTVEAIRKEIAKDPNHPTPVYTIIINTDGLSPEEVLLKMLEEMYNHLTTSTQ